MASAITRAKNELVKLTSKAKQLRERHKQEAEALQQGAAVLAGAAVAALVDEKFAGDGVAEVKGIPTNALLGGAMVGGAALVKGMPFRAELAAAGLGVASTAVYNLIRKNVQFDAAG
jgi:hypothetical protein